RMETKLRVFDSEEELATGLADYVAHLSEAAVKERGAFAVALSGGSLIKHLGKLTGVQFLKTVDWSRWHVFWAEEKVVAKKNPDSNYRQAKLGLLSKVPITPAHVVSVNQGVSAESAAEEYEFAIRQQVRNRTVGVSRSSDSPRFDLVLLVLGPDGHVASLYPNHPVLMESSQWIHPVCIPGRSDEAVTFTLPVINSAAKVVILATGTSVAPQLASALGERLPNGTHPAQLVDPLDGNLVWFADVAAASFISKSAT
ncbi:probable 6-phosphogluconolactonase 1, partial [Aristolochia californica]|uniref:probable 6-phosphogluconolactonase 1 n=1 Tax=Aristolochia californica TaxID=171875 RepID=UPI0035DD2D83